MTQFTNYAESQIATHLFGDTAWARPTIYLAAFEVMPDDAGAGATEATYTSYARTALTQTDAAWTATTITDGQRIENAATVSFPTPGATDGADLVGVGVYDAVTGGNLICYVSLDAAVTPTLGVAITFAINALKWELTDSNSKLCDPLAVAILDHIFRTTTWTQYAAMTMDLCTTMPNQAGVGAVAHSGTGYTQPDIGPDESIWTLPTGGNGLAVNAAPVVFGLPTADWTGINGQIISGDSDVLFRHTFGDAPRTYDGGKTVNIATAGLTVTVA